VREKSIKVLNNQEIEGMRKVCRVSTSAKLAVSTRIITLTEQLAREVLDLVASHIKPGITTDELDAICHQACLDRDSYPSPLNYSGFPKSVCTSVNEVICHVSSIPHLDPDRIANLIGYPRSTSTRYVAALD
jgi:methionyl aminopeptidase